MLDLFYLLVILQIALGLYSLWDGFQWLTLVRRRLSSHAGFYTPAAAVICPCKGNEPGLEENLTALTRFDYANYEIFFSLASNSDAAIKIIERVKAASQRPVHLVIAGPAQDCGEKVHNLSRAVEDLPEKFEIMVFVDSDVRFSKGWLTKIVAPLQDHRIGATTGYRWFIPSRPFGSGGFASAMASAWNASIATLLGNRSRENFCWGGGTAIRRHAFEDARVQDAWAGAVSDDFALTTALIRAGKPIIFCPECLAATPHPWTGRSLIEFTNRQILISRVYAPRRWMMGAAAHLSYSLTLLYAIWVIFRVTAQGDPSIQLVLMTSVIVLLAAIKGALRTVAVGEMLPDWKAQINQWSWVWFMLAPVVPFLFSWNFISSLLTKRIRWRNIRYELVSPTITRVLSR